MSSAALPILTGQSHQPFVQLIHPCGDSAEIYLQGAHLTSWRCVQNGEQLFLSRQAVFGEGKAIRGGVPVIFPQFGAFGPGAKHGFARNILWQLDVQASGASCAEFTLGSNAQTLAAWAFNFAARYRVEIAPGVLTLQLQIKNTADQPIHFTSALHTYLASSDYRQGTLSGLAELEYWDNGTPWDQRKIQTDNELTIADALDRVYFHALQPLLWRDQTRALAITAKGFKDVVVWNPGYTGVTSLPDMADDEFQNMLCVEAANVAEPIELLPGDTWQGSQQLALTD
ncbi:MAG TPA: D-hexose-6-phosphate mutarotase [Cellvibrionaceae bacterium]